MLLAACAADPPATPTVGATAPDFALPALDGGRVALRDQRGNVVIVNFWATWCPPCENETPRLVEWYQTHEDLQILGVDTLYQDSRAAVEAFAARYAIPYPILLDESGDVAKQWEARFLPRSYVIDRDGVIRFVKLGELTDEDFATQIAPLLAATAGS
jgi:cytochrome c biogenesis protein CcmG/thiol:disulfide interchange protein DsbE